MRRDEGGCMEEDGSWRNFSWISVDGSNAGAGIFGERCGVISRWRYLIVIAMSHWKGRFGWIDGVGLGKEG
jgi:hypothetical protein